MENSSKVFAVPHAREYWPMARADHMDLQLSRVRRMNVLLTGSDGVIQNALSRLVPSLQGPVQIWRPSERLVLPIPADVGTLILRDVGALLPVDQCRLLVWLEEAAGFTQVVSTTAAPLLARVEASLFLDSLYYRLNTVCVDVTV
jgi:Sigma-54 interaction domain